MNRKASLQTKFLLMCLMLVALSITAISVVYYQLTIRDKHRESRQRIQIAFDIVLESLENQRQTYLCRFPEYLQQNTTFSITTYLYNQNTKQMGMLNYIVSSFSKITDELKNFGSTISMDQLCLYSSNKRLLAVYQHQEGQEDTVGGYVISATGQDAYLPMEDFSHLSAMYTNNTPIPDTPLPDGVAASYTGDIPKTTQVDLFREGGRLGLKIIAPIFYNDEITGLLVGKTFLAQEFVERHALLSGTAINVYAGQQFSLGTLEEHAEIKAENLQQLIACDTLLRREQRIAEVTPVMFGHDEYYQGQCALTNADGKRIGTLSVNLSQAFEQQEIRKMFKAVLTVSVLVIGVAFGSSILFSHKAIRSIHHLVSIIGSATEGDLRTTAVIQSQDEIGLMAEKLNQMIIQLRAISGQVQHAAHSVNLSAGTILQQMNALIAHLEQQSGSVDETTETTEQIKQFIDLVAQHTNELLSAAGEILAAIQETRSSINEVTTSTSSLTTELHQISTSAEEVKQSVKQIAENTSQLKAATQQAQREIHSIDDSLQDVSLNADHAQQLARETMDAATEGQTSVEASFQGMTELKEMVSNTADIIQEVNSWGEQVTSILDIVDDITEQTSLLALNASIISAQAGSHGKGFAVVANEIKELATRTKSSTQEIGTLVRELRNTTQEGVHHTEEGLKKAEQGLLLGDAVREALTRILERATRSSHRAADTARVIQQTVESSQALSTTMNRVAEMVAHMTSALHQEEQNVEHVVVAVENISGMAEQVNRATVEQKRAAEEIEHSMGDVTERFSGISERTETLQYNTNQIVAAMHDIEAITEEILANTTTISEETVKNLVQQSKLLQQAVEVFKVS